MSTTLSTTQMVARLQRKFPLGLSANDCMDFLNEGFRKIDQMSKGGFLWQVGNFGFNLPAGASTTPNLPADFDPGKSAWVVATTASYPVKTIIPYKSYADFLNQQHFSAGAIGLFSAWTFQPFFGATYQYVIRFLPDSAFPLPLGINFNITYHKLSFAPFAVGPAIYFPTPDQFDSLIIDLAEAELSRVYSKAGWEKIQGNALQSVAEMIDTYRTDRYDLAGLSDLVIQAQERQADKAK